MIINFPNIIAGALISNYIQNPKFRNEVNKNFQQILGYGIDALNGVNKLPFNIMQNKPVAGDNNVYDTTEQTAE